MSRPAETKAPEELLNRLLEEAKKKHIASGFKEQEFNLDLKSIRNVCNSQCYLGGGKIDYLAGDPRIVVIMKDETLGFVRGNVAIARVEAEALRDIFIGNNSGDFLNALSSALLNLPDLHEAKKKKKKK